MLNLIGDYHGDDLRTHIPRAELYHSSKSIPSLNAGTAQSSLGNLVPSSVLHEQLHSHAHTLRDMNVLYTLTRNEVWLSRSDWAQLSNYRLLEEYKECNKRGRGITSLRNVAHLLTKEGRLQFWNDWQPVSLPGLALYSGWSWDGRQIFSMLILCLLWLPVWFKDFSPGSWVRQEETGHIRSPLAAPTVSNRHHLHQNGCDC